MSFMCAHANSIEQMILWRALQGFIGGGMIPTVFASAFTIFPRVEAAADRARSSASSRRLRRPSGRPSAAISPTCFPGTGCSSSTRPRHHRHRRRLAADRLRRAGLVAADPFRLFRPRHDGGLPRRAGICARGGAVEGLVRERAGDARRSCISAVSCVAFFWRMLTARQPIVDLTAFRDRNFWTGSMFAFVLGIGLYGLTYIYPVYLAVVRGYSSLMIGKTMFVTGVCMFLTAPLAGRLMTQGRPAPDDRGRLHPVRRRHLSGLLRHRRLGFLGALVAADLPRRRPDAVDGADQQSWRSAPCRRRRSRTPRASST